MSNLLYVNRPVPSGNPSPRERSLSIRGTWVIAVFLIIVISSHSLHADTTWVAGEVWGVWGRRGNPYMVTDTLTIPQDSTLQIMPGVEIYFQDQEIRRTPIWVYGRLRAIGVQGDSVYFYSGQAGFGGINNRYTPGTEIRMEYAVVDSLHERIYSHQGHVVIRQSRICGCQHQWAALMECSQQIDTVEYCSLFGGEVIFALGGPSVFQYNQGQELYGTWQQMALIVGNQLRQLDFDQSPWIEICDNQIGYAQIYGGSASIHNNDIQGLFSSNASNVLFENNSVNNIFIAESQGIYRNNVVHDSLNNYGIWLFNTNSVTVEKNLITTNRWGIEVYNSDNNLIRNNTVIFGDKGIYAFSGSNGNQIINNIFVGDGVNCTGVYSTSPTNFNIGYNDFYQVNTVTYNCELDTGNIFLDPCFRAGSPYDYQLQANSPCIDAGDPTSPLDPDGTRADMGCYFFDHRIDNPPAIISPVTVNVQRGTTLRYVARATDDNGPLQFDFWDLPPWLQEETIGLDWVEDSAAVSGMVPYNQEDFTFGVWVEDGSAQRDSQVVSVLVSQYTILAGEVTGVLTREQSPYLVVEDVIVPAGDSLRIEPGVEIRFQWEPIEDLRHRIVVRGKLNAIGTPEDTIYFLPEYGDSLLNAWQGINCIGSSNDTSVIDFAYFLSGKYGVVADSQATVTVKHSKMINTRYGCYIQNNAWIGVDSCQFPLSDQMGVAHIFADSANATISNCDFQMSQEPGAGTNIAFWFGCQGTVETCTFALGGACGCTESCQVNIIGNIFLNTDGAGIGDRSHGIISNNIFIGGDGITTGIIDSALVSNNLFYHTGTAIKLYSVNPQASVKNNIFLAGQIGIEMYNSYPPFTEISYNDFFDNDSNFVNCIPDSTNLYVDPMVQDTIDFHLTLGSPCIDAGDPSPFFNDVDSTRNDIGCWGGPWGESYPYVPALSHQTKPLPLDFALLPPYPNPFNSVLVIPFTLPVEKEVIINVFNILGQKVHQFAFPPMSPGVHRVVWNSGSCSSGLYIIQLISGGKEFNQKCLLLK